MPRKGSQRADTRPGQLAHVPPRRRPLYAFGASLRDQHGFVGRVDVIYADYWSALNTFAVRDGWFEVQTIPPSTKDQSFYALVGLDGVGAVLVGELDAREA